jgi:DNA-binding transcriptional ArsR family regulator
LAGEPVASTVPATPPGDLSLIEQYVRVFDALSEPVRVHILAQFVDDECSCTLLDEVLPVSKSTISYHVKVLRTARLIEVEKSGRFYNYRLVRETFEFFVPGFLQRLASGMTGRA